MSRTTDPELRRRWRQLLDSFDPQRYTVAEFCERNGISVASFYKWRKRFNQTPKILPVEIIENSTATQKAAVIKIGNHAQIEIQPGHTQIATEIALALAKLERLGDQEVTR
jgi:transposase-like protein